MRIIKIVKSMYVPSINLSSSVLKMANWVNVELPLHSGYKIS